MLVVEFSPDGSIEPNHEKMTRNFAVTRTLMHKEVGDVRALQHLLGLSTWFLFRPAMSIFQKYYIVQRQRCGAINPRKMS